MKKLLAFTLIFNFIGVLPTQAESPSIWQSIKQFASETPDSLKTYEKVCHQELDQSVLDSKSSWKPVCEILNKSELCQEANPREPLNCKDPADAQVSYPSLVFNRHCAVGAGMAIKDFFIFIGKAILWAGANTFNTKTDKKGVKARDKTKQQFKDANMALKGYIATEKDKLYEENLQLGLDEQKAEKKAKKDVAGEVMRQIFAKLGQMMNDKFYHMGCYSKKERSERLCKMMTEFMAPPVAMIGLLSKGIKLGSKTISKLVIKNADKKAQIGRYALSKEHIYDRNQLFKKVERGQTQYMQYIGLSNKAIKENTKLSKEWMEEVERLKLKLPKNKQIEIETAFAKLNTDSELTRRSVLAITNRYKNGEDPLILIESLLKKKKGLNAIDTNLAKFLSKKDGIHPELSKGFLVRLESEKPNVFAEVMSQIEYGKLTPKQYQRVLNFYKKSNDPLEALKKGLKRKKGSEVASILDEIKLTAPQYIPLNLRSSLNLQLSSSKPLTIKTPELPLISRLGKKIGLTKSDSYSKQAARDFIYKNIAPEKRSAYRVIQTQKNGRYEVATTADELYMLKLEAPHLLEKATEAKAYSLLKSKLLCTP